MGNTRGPKRSRVLSIAETLLVTGTVRLSFFVFPERTKEIAKLCTADCLKVDIIRAQSAKLSNSQASIYSE